MINGAPQPSHLANIDWTATSTVAAAWAQAILTAGAVWMAAGLQDRAVRKRDLAERNRQLEGLAAVVRFANQAVQGATDRLTQSMTPRAVAEALQDGFLTGPADALQEISVSELGDVDLIAHTLRFIDLFRDAAQIFGQLKAVGRNTNFTLAGAIDARAAVGAAPTEVFNGAASVERRVAELVGRPALL